MAININFSGLKIFTPGYYGDPNFRRTTYILFLNRMLYPNMANPLRRYPRPGPKR